MSRQQLVTLIGKEATPDSDEAAWANDNGEAATAVTAQWQLAFDASQKPFDWDSAASALPFLAIAIVLWIFRKTPALRKPLWGGVFPLVLGGFALLWTILVGFSTVADYFAAQSALSSGTADVVEGPVENFHAMPSSGHDTERFDVAGVHFEYSDYVLTAGFNNTSSHGGPMHAGLYTRIHYVPGRSRPMIVRLEIRQ